MQTKTRELFSGYLGDVANLNGVASAIQQFVVAPSVDQKLIDLIQQGSEFLQHINFYGVDQQIGEKVGLSIASTIASRTDTTGAGERTPVDPSDLNAEGYHCRQTNFDTALRYAKLDAWAKFPDFAVRIGRAIAEQIRRDRIMIGWNGESAAATTNRVANPFLQDVNIGWFKKLKDHNNGARVLSAGATPNEVRVGPGGDYLNIDQLVHDMRTSLLDPWFARDNTFTVCTNLHTVDEKYFPMVGTYGGQPMESNALDMMLSAKKLGGLQVAEVPYFPERALFITYLKKGSESNLSIYQQNGTHRKYFEDFPKKDRVENYESVNEDYVIENFGASCAAINIKLPNGAGGWA